MGSDAQNAGSPKIRERGGGTRTTLVIWQSRSLVVYFVMQSVVVGARKRGIHWLLPRQTLGSWKLRLPTGGCSALDACCGSCPAPGAAGLVGRNPGIAALTGGPRGSIAKDQGPGGPTRRCRFRQDFSIDRFPSFTSSLSSANHGIRVGSCDCRMLLQPSSGRRSKSNVFQSYKVGRPSVCES